MDASRRAPVGWRLGVMLVALSVLGIPPAGAQDPAPALTPMCGSSMSDPHVIVPLLVTAEGDGDPMAADEVSAAILASDHLFLEASSLHGEGRRLRLPTISEGSACRIDVRTARVPADLLRADDHDVRRIRNQVLARLSADGQLDGLPAERTLLLVLDTECLPGGLASDALATVCANSLWPEVMLHELVHSWGAVQPGSAFFLAEEGDSTGLGHCLEGGDIMCYSSFEMCPVRWQGGAGRTREALDCNEDSYFAIDPRPGSFLASHPQANIAEHPALIPVPAVDLPAVSLELTRDGDMITVSARSSPSAGATIEEYQWNVLPCPIPGDQVGRSTITFDASMCNPDYELGAVAVSVRDSAGWHAGARVPFVYGDGRVRTRLLLSGGRQVTAGEQLELAVAALTPTEFWDFAGVPAGTAVVLEERRGDGRWQQVATARLDGNGYARFTLGPLDVGTHAWRAVLPAAGQFDGTTSAVEEVDARPAETVVRRFGADRYATATALSRELFAAGTAGTVVLARGDGASGFADALAGTPLAVSLGAPLLLTAVDDLPAATIDELRRVAPRGASVIALGGRAAIAPQVLDEVARLGYQVSRIGGRDRYETATLIADRLGSPQRIWLAAGTDFPDALVAGTAAARTGGAVLLTAGDRPHPATTSWLHGHSSTPVTAIGGPAMRAYPERDGIGGSDRFSTAALVMQEMSPRGPAVVIARGDAFPDALAGGVFAGLRGGRLLLTGTHSLPEPTTATLCSPDLEQVLVVGGRVAVSDRVVASLERLLPC